MISARLGPSEATQLPVDSIGQAGQRLQIALAECNNCAQPLEVEVDIPPNMKAGLDGNNRVILVPAPGGRRDSDQFAPIPDYEAMQVAMAALTCAAVGEDMSDQPSMQRGPLPSQHLKRKSGSSTANLSAGLNSASVQMVRSGSYWHGQMLARMFSLQPAALAYPRKFAPKCAGEYLCRLLRTRSSPRPSPFAQDLARQFPHIHFFNTRRCAYASFS